MFQGLYHLIKPHGDDAEDDYGCDHHVELEEADGGNDKNIPYGSVFRVAQALAFQLIPWI